MANRIDEFVRTLKGGIRGNRFQIIVNLPGGINADSRTLDIMAKSTNIPAMETGVIELNYHGKLRKIAGDERSAGEWTVSAYLNNSGKLADAKRIADQWQKLSANSSNIDEYITDGIIHVLSPKDGNPVLTYKIKNIWVSNSGDLPLDMDSVDEVLAFDITFNYDDVEAA